MATVRFTNPALCGCRAGVSSVSNRGWLKGVPPFRLFSRRVPRQSMTWEDTLSFAYLALYTGDYLRDTRHLSPLKHGVYLLLLMHCWDQKGPLPLDEQECSGVANCRSSDEIEALRYVLDRYFVRMDDGWYNRRIQREIERSHAIGLKRKAAGALGYQAKAKHLPSKSQASASNTTPTTIPNTIPTPKEKPKALAPFALPDWVPQKQWEAWLTARAKIRKAPTEFAKKMAVSKLEELQQQGHHPAAVLAQSAFNNWTDLYPVKEVKV